MPKTKKSKIDSSQEKVLESLPRSVEQKAAGNYVHIVGVDEAGRGPLAGPVVAAACIVENGVSIEGIIDSKQTKEEDREKTFEILVNHPAVTYGVSVVSHTEIDEVNILQATMNAMRRATNEVLLKLSKSKSKIPSSDCIALIDGNRVPTEMPIEAKYVIKGDGSMFSIAAASIIAKVTRDRIMVELDKKYPQYNLAQHKGYPTFEHRSLLMKHGPSEIHRTSYGPVKQAMIAHGIPLPESKKKEEQEVEDVEVLKGRAKKNTSLKTKKVKVPRESRESTDHGKKSRTTNKVAVEDEVKPMHTSRKRKGADSEETTKVDINNVRKSRHKK